MDVQWSHSPVTLKPKLILQARNLGFEGNRRMGPARPTARPLTGNPLRDVRSRNPSKSTLAHDAVGTAVLQKHHPIIRFDAGLIHFVYRSHLKCRERVLLRIIEILWLSDLIYPKGKQSQDVVAHN